MTSRSSSLSIAHLPVRRLSGQTSSSITGDAEQGEGGTLSLAEHLIEREVDEIKRYEVCWESDVSGGYS